MWSKVGDGWSTSFVGAAVGPVAVMPNKCRYGRAVRVHWESASGCEVQEKPHCADAGRASAPGMGLSNPCGAAGLSFPVLHSRTLSQLPAG